jgi:outer membrane murein-binding lipoprotein Lpp
MRKWVVLVLAACLALGMLSGCSSSGKTDEMTTTVPKEDQAPAKAGDASKSSGNTAPSTAPSKKSTDSKDSSTDKGGATPDANSSKTAK